MSGVPVPISGGLSFTPVSAGGCHSCGGTKDAQAFYSGSNGSGQLGDGNAPVDTDGPSSVVTP